VTDAVATSFAVTTMNLNGPNTDKSSSHGKAIALAVVIALSLSFPGYASARHSVNNPTPAS
jgi:hypothetical protein